MWLRPLETEAHGQGGGHQVKVHPYEVHVRLRARREGDQTGATQLGDVRGALAVLRQRYGGTRPFVAALPDLIAIQAEEGPLDRDPDHDDLLDGTLVLRVLER